MDLGGRLKATVVYDGTLFSGYQVQPNMRTVQQEIERAIGKIHKKSSWATVASGRTDTGVHSLGQTIHFDTPLTMKPPQWKKALNSLLPEDIFIKNVEKTSSDFHARYDAVGKTYEYKVTTAKERNVFERNMSYHLPYELSYEKMLEASKYLIGTYDFTSFSSPRTSVVDKVRTIYDIQIYRQGEGLLFTYLGSGFLYQMVRILTGTLLEVGKGRISPSDVEEILEKKDRSMAGPTAPGHGLYLKKVYYDLDELGNCIKQENMIDIEF